MPGRLYQRSARRAGGPLLEHLSYSSRQATYDDLRRLIRTGVITRIPGTQRYQLTPFGRRIATWFTKPHSRVLTPGWPGRQPMAIDPAGTAPTTTRSAP